MKEKTWDVVICGAGPVGLTLSILLSRQGVQHLLLEKREAISQVPRARGINCRTVEIWDRFGITPELDRYNLSSEWLSKIVYQETLAGELVGIVPTAMSMPGACAEWTPVDTKCIAQDRTDAILREHAGRYEQATLRFSTSIVGVEQSEELVTLTTVDEMTQLQESVQTRWLVACDGARSGIRQMEGIEFDGVRIMDSFVNAHFYADLSRWTQGREAPLLWNMKPGCEGVFGPFDGKEFWRCQINFNPAAHPADAWTNETVEARIREMIGLPEAASLPIRMHSFYTHTVRSGIAERFIKDRVILAGDSAHQIPPHGAMGMNSGVQSAHNLAWKLATVIRGQASAKLLATYETERKEVAQRVCNYAFSNYDKVLQIRKSASQQAQREAVRNARSYGNAVGLDLGVHYSSAGAFVDDGSVAPATKDAVGEYIPTAKPGYRAPHLWLRKADARVSTIELFEKTFVLLCASKGSAWISALSSLDLQLDVMPIRIGADGDFVDEGGRFASLYGIDDDGAVLVRPDGHVAYRSAKGVDDPAAVLRSVIHQVLGR